MKLSKTDKANRAKWLVFIDKAYFSFHSHSYVNKNSYGSMDSLVLVIDAELVFRQL